MTNQRAYQTDPHKFDTVYSHVFAFQVVVSIRPFPRMRADVLRFSTSAADAFDDFETYVTPASYTQSVTKKSDFFVPFFVLHKRANKRQPVYS